MVRQRSLAENIRGMLMPVELILCELFYMEGKSNYIGNEHVLQCLQSRCETSGSRSTRVTAQICRTLGLDCITAGCYSGRLGEAFSLLIEGSS